MRFIAVTAAAASGFPPCARAADEPAAVPSEVAAPSPPPYVQREPGGRPHLHGPNAVTWVPERKPVDWNMEVLDGPEFRLRDYRGAVVFVNVFATWCGPCRSEQPAMVRFARAHDADTRVVGVDVHEEDKLVREYRTSFTIPYP
ncbi:MAG TPA: TlpA disulfide reductase family protein, partial [Candidatus Elarobacter sp.]